VKVMASAPGSMHNDAAASTAMPTLLRVRDAEESALLMAARQTVE